MNLASLLHDAVEDQGGEATLSEIRRRFGDPVAEIVVGCAIVGAFLELGAPVASDLAQAVDEIERLATSSIGHPR